MYGKPRAPRKKVGGPQNSNLYNNANERKALNAYDQKITRRQRKGKVPCHEPHDAAFLREKAEETKSA